MCGIVGYIGKKNAYPVILTGLRHLEYRGYDSAGIALFSDGIKVHKKKGRVSDLEKFIEGKDVSGTIGIGHTRWATHGEPSDANAHPHATENGDVAVVHNGIIENALTLRSFLQSRGHVFSSETDTEVIAHLIEEMENEKSKSFFDSVRRALNRLVGAYAIAALSVREPGTMVVAKKGSPLVIGVGEGEFFVASDAYPISEHTKKVVYLEDGEVAALTASGIVEIRTIENEKRTPRVKKIDLEIEALEKDGFDHFMQKEIFEQPCAVRDCLRGRLSVPPKKAPVLNLGGLRDVEEKLFSAERFVFLGCGTSWHAGLIGRRFFETLTRVPSIVQYASEFRYEDPLVRDTDVFVAVSQSGETADTLAAMKLAKERGATVLGVCNVVGSSVAREAHAGLYTHAGPEIGVASTKAFTTQIAALFLIAARCAEKRNALGPRRFGELLETLRGIPEKIGDVLGREERIRDIAERFGETKNAVYLGRGISFPVALEGALKLKEISYVHAEGYPAAEMKHGPIALVDENMPVVIVAPRGEHHEKIVSNAEEIRARKGKIIAVVSEGDASFDSIAEDVIEIPECDELFSPFLSVIPLQLLAYYVAALRGCDVDRPRNLAKSVTVE